MHPSSPFDRRHFLAWLALSTPALSALAANEPLPELTGATLSNQTITLQQLRGRVVLVFFWSTECPVCLNKMPELRANMAGWHGQNFTLLGVNMDPQKETFEAYENVVNPLLAEDRKFNSVWGKAPGYTDNLNALPGVPSAVLLDKEGKVAERYSGRIPAQAWDRIADLL